MKIVFFGTPEYVVPVLETLHKAFKNKVDDSPVAAVVTQAPKPSGRKQELAYSPVDSWAYKKNVAKYFNPIDVVNQKITADIGILASYGAIISGEVINHFPFGILNIHPSLLPRWRGSSPVQATIIAEDPAGATIIKIDEKLDHGQIIAQFKDEVTPTDTTESLRSRLFERSAEILTTLIPAYVSGKITPREQDHDKATFTREIKKEDAFIPAKYVRAALDGKGFRKKWEIPFIRDYSTTANAHTINNFVRAMQPWPQAWSTIKVDGKEMRIKLLKSHIQEECLELDEVQLEGKNPVSWKQFENAYNVRF